MTNPMPRSAPPISGDGLACDVQSGQIRRRLAVELGMWDQPHRNTWINQLNLAIRAADRPVILAAHSLGCLAVAWWAQPEQPGPRLMPG